MFTLVDGLEVEEAPDIVVVRFSKALGLYEDNVTAIAADLLRVADRLGQRTLSLDLARVDFLASSALGQLIRLHKEVQAGGGRLVLRNASPRIYEVFEVTRVHTFMEITPPVTLTAPAASARSGPSVPG